jgi:CheY-like chemotaxis protein
MNNQPLKILVVEDNPGDVRLLKTYLNSAATQLKFEVTHADRLSAALELLGRMGFDAILLDLGLPDGPQS